KEFFLRLGLRSIVGLWPFRSVVWDMRRPTILFQSSAWNYCISQDAFAQPSAQVLRCQLRIAGQPHDAEPKPGSNRDVENEFPGLKLPIANEAVHLRNFEAQV